MEVKAETFRVRTFECQVDGTVSMFALMGYMQEIAAGHAEALGFGFERLNALDGYWVLSNIRIEIARLPRRDEEVTIRTWPSGYTRTVATREFIGEDGDGRETFRAGSEWMVINKKTNRLKNLFRLDLGLPKTGEKALAGELRRLEPRGDYRPVDRLRVPYSSIDLNGHVNNTEYVRWGIDALRRAITSQGDIRSLQATYLSEVFEAEEVELAVSTDRDGKSCVLARRADEQDVVFLMEVAW